VDKKLLRILDANFNRTKEGLRVCEDICRFVFDAPGMTRQYKDVRHKISDAVRLLGAAQLLKARDIVADVGKKTSRSEARRRDTADIFYANVQRVKESIRVLEEFGKLINPRAAEQLKRLRYRVYALEQQAAKKI